MELMYFTFIALFLGVSLLSSPMLLGYVLVLSSILAGMLLGALGEKWFMFIFFLIFTGGMMVMILYITNMAANTKLRESDVFGLTCLGALILFPGTVEDKSLGTVYSLIDGFSWEVVYFLMGFLLLGLFLVVFLVEKSFGALR